MKVLVTGATGFIGQKVVEELFAAGHGVRVLTRNSERARAVVSPYCELATWEPEKSFSDDTFLKGIDSVIHLAGEGIADRRWTAAQKKRIYDSRVLGTRYLIAALTKMGGQLPQSFICASAIGYYGDRGDEILTESSPKGVGFLADLCNHWEVEAHSAPKPMRSVSIRIGIVLGKGGGALKKMLPIFRLGLGGSIGSGNQWMSWIHMRDLAKLFVEAATNSDYQGVVNGVAPNPTTNALFSKALGSTLRRPVLLPAPAFALGLIMGELSQLVLASQRVIPNVLDARGFKFQFPTLEPALNQILK